MPLCYIRALLIIFNGNALCYRVFIWPSMPYLIVLNITFYILNKPFFCPQWKRARRANASVNLSKG